VDERRKSDPRRTLAAANEMRAEASGTANRPAVRILSEGSVLSILISRFVIEICNLLQEL